MARLSLISIPCAILLVAEPERRLTTAVALLSLAYTVYAVLAPQAGPTPEPPDWTRSWPTSARTP
ncbi:hypothetical protein ACWDGI_22220 [Streptomyces sp. NPDC001220]